MLPWQQSCHNNQSSVEERRDGWRWPWGIWGVGNTYAHTDSCTLTHHWQHANQWLEVMVMVSLSLITQKLCGHGVCRFTKPLISEDIECRPHPCVVYIRITLLFGLWKVLRIMFSLYFITNVYSMQSNFKYNIWHLGQITIVPEVMFSLDLKFLDTFSFYSKALSILTDWMAVKPSWEGCRGPSWCLIGGVIDLLHCRETFIPVLYIPFKLSVFCGQNMDIAVFKGLTFVFQVQVDWWVKWMFCFCRSVLSVMH